MLLRLRITKTGRRLFSAFNQEKFTKRGIEISEFVERLNEGTKDDFVKGLTAEEKERVDLFYDAFFAHSPESVNYKFMLYCFTRQLEVKSPEELCYNYLDANKEDYKTIKDPVAEYYEQSKLMSNHLEDLTKDMDFSKLSSSASENQTADVQEVVEEEDPSKKRYKVSITGFDAAAKLKVIKELKTLLGIGLKDVS